MDKGSIKRWSELIQNPNWPNVSPFIPPFAAIITDSDHFEYNLYSSSGSASFDTNSGRNSVLIQFTFKLMEKRSNFPSFPVSSFGKELCRKNFRIYIKVAGMECNVFQFAIPSKLFSNKNLHLFCSSSRITFYLHRLRFPGEERPKEHKSKQKKRNSIFSEKKNKTNRIKFHIDFFDTINRQLIINWNSFLFKLSQKDDN